MEQHEPPKRIIYAKLTTTGAYDVVAHSPGVRLDEARSLAEQHLPGNPPLDAGNVELIGYHRVAGGTSIVLCFSRYAWKDGDRGDVYSTDILLLSDHDFRRARFNPFAVVQRTDAVFDVLTELPTPVIEERTAAQEHARLQELAHVRGDARTVIANALAADPVLLMHAGDAAAVMELFTLLLPPSLRTQLTFLTQTFRVPAIMPRVTLADRQAANLRGGTWTVLPSPQVDVPIQLADLLISLADDPAALALTHEMYDEAYAGDVAGSRPLRTGVERVVRLAALAAELHGSNVQNVLSRLAEPETDAAQRAAGLRRLRARGADETRLALVQMLRTGGTAAAQVQALIEADEKLDAATTAALIDALPANAPTDLVLALSRRAAAEGNVAQLLELLTRDRRGVAAQLARTKGRVPEDFLRLLDALRLTAAPTWDIAAAARLLDEAAALHDALPDPAAERLLNLCRHTVDEALQHLQPAARAVGPLRQLLEAAAAYRVASRTIAAPPLLPEKFDEAQHFASAYPAPCCAALGTALLDRALDAHAAANADQCARSMAMAVTLLAPAGAAAREPVRQLLAQRGVSEHDLVAVPGTEQLLPLLGGTASHALVTRRIITAITHAAGQEDGIAELAGAVFAAHLQRVRITPGSETSQRVVSALQAFSSGSEPHATAAAELCLELLSVITPPDHMPAFEEAALGSHMTVRLRRLDRSIAACRAAEDEQQYDRIAAALESGRVPLEDDARERLTRALGTGGISRRLMRMIASVVEKEAS